MEGDIQVSAEEVTTQRWAEVCQGGVLAGTLQEISAQEWQFAYIQGYEGIPVSLTMPVQSEPYHFNGFPPVFDGLLPEGPQLEALLRKHKIDRSDSFQQLITVGGDMVGSLTVRLPKERFSQIEEGGA
jgi:serine/threonine-protein kinase HipA